MLPCYSTSFQTKPSSAKDGMRGSLVPKTKGLGIESKKINRICLKYMLWSSATADLQHSLPSCKLTVAMEYPPFSIANTLKLHLQSGSIFQPAMSVSPGVCTFFQWICLFRGMKPQRGPGDSANSLNQLGSVAYGYPHNS